jgi:hypothetical protein
MENDSRCCGLTSDRPSRVSKTNILLMDGEIVTPVAADGLAPPPSVLPSDMLGAFVLVSTPIAPKPASWRDSMRTFVERTASHLASPQTK